MTRRNRIFTDCSSLSFVERDEKLLLAKEVADLLRVTPAYVLHLARIGSIPSIRIGKLVRFEHAAVDAFIQSKINI